MNSTDYMGRLLECHLHKKSTRQAKIDPSLVYIQLGPILACFRLSDTALNRS